MRTTACYLGSAVLHACGLALAAWGGGVVTSPVFQVIPGEVSVAGSISSSPIDSQWDPKNTIAPTSLQAELSLPFERSLRDTTAAALAELPQLEPVDVPAGRRPKPQPRFQVTPFPSAGNDALNPVPPQARPDPDSNTPQAVSADSRPAQESESQSQSASVDTGAPGAPRAETGKTDSTLKVTESEQKPARKTPAPDKPFRDGRPAESVEDSGTPRDSPDRRNNSTSRTRRKEKQDRQSSRPAQTPGSAASDSSGAKVDQYPRELPGNPSPDYPEEARRAGAEGVVYLLAEIGSDGRARRLKVYRSSGHLPLDDSALKAVSSWRFRAATQAGRAVSCRVVIPVRFRILDE